MEQIFPRESKLFSRPQIEAEAEVIELQHQLELQRAIEASLRAELAAEREDNLRWRRRTWALEARLEHITNIAGGHAVVDEDDGAEGEG